MPAHRRVGTVLAGLLLLIAGPAMPGASPPGLVARPVLLELFTSESCSSCPPADRYLGELAQRPGLIALSFHVNYWNHLDWVDASSSPLYTARQRDYAARLGSSMYTPQLVIDGRAEAIGSQRGAVEAALRKARDGALGLPLQIARQQDRLKWSLGAAVPGRLEGPGRIQLLAIVPRVEQAVRSGENAGRRLVSHRVVRSLRTLGEWTGVALNGTDALRAEEREGPLVMLVQDREGHVIALASLP